MKRLYRTTGSDAVLCGVCGGIARYFGVDPTLVRLATVLLVAFAGLSLDNVCHCVHLALSGY